MSSPPPNSFEGRQVQLKEGDETDHFSINDTDEEIHKFEDICTKILNKPQFEPEILEMLSKYKDNPKVLHTTFSTLLISKIKYESWEKLIQNPDFIMQMIENITCQYHCNISHQKFMRFELFETNIKTITKIIEKSDHISDKQAVISKLQDFRIDEKYKYMNKFVVKTSEYLDNSLTTTAEAMRYNIIRKHRLAIMISMINHFDDYEQLIKDEESMRNFILEPQEITPPTISPQMIQQASQLITQIHANLSGFAAAVSEVTKPSELNMLVNSSIPSLFGYFASPEHLQLGFSFYMNVLSTGPKKLRPRILYPFFKSPVVFPFIESAFQPFFQKLIRDDRIKNLNIQDKESISQLAAYYATYMQTQIIKSVRCLHSTHAILLRFVRQLWPLNATLHFIINMFIKAHVMRWIEGIGLNSKKEFLEQVFEKIIQTKEIYTSILDKICDATASFELPDMYTSFDLPYLVFYSSCQDLSLLAKVYRQKNDLSPSITTFNTTDTPMLGMFWFRLFPKRPLPHSMSQRSMVFSQQCENLGDNPDYERLWLQVISAAQNSQTEPYDFVLNSKNNDKSFIEYAKKAAINRLVNLGSTFETFLNHKLYFSMISKWLETITTYETLLVRPYIDKMVRHQLEDKVEADVVLKRALKKFSNRLLQQSAFFYYIETKIPLIHKNHEKKIKKLSELFYIRLNNPEEEDLNPHLTSVVGNKLYYAAVERIKDFDLESTMTTFRSILDVNLLLMKATETDNIKTNLFNCVMHMSIIPDLPIFYILANELVLKNENFQELLTETEQRCWVMFEQAILKLVVRDNKLMNIFFPLQQEVGNLAK